jgi:ABC-2 type transport system ATP-binding protein
MSITVSNLTKIYGQQKAVNNISFTVNKGQIVGFLGPNGAGKSTTFKIITGYLAATNGAAQVCNINVAQNPQLAKSSIGYLPEANPLYPDMYVREYLTFIAGMHQLANTKQAIETAITTVGLTPEANKKIHQLSKGYKQRVGIAAALIHNPEVLILDEPTSGLDPNQIIEIREVIKNLGKTKTVLFSSHIMQEVSAICDKVIIINKGTIVANDTLSNLQNATNQQNTLMVQFDAAVTTSALQNLPEVINVTPQPNHSFLVTAKNIDAAKKQLMQFALNNNVNIQTLTSGSNTELESIFRSLTT